MRSVLIAAAAVLALVLASPAGACAADDPCLEDPLSAMVTGESWWDYNANSVRDADENDRVYPGLRVFADYNGDGRRQNGEAMVEVQHDGTYRLPVDTRKLTMGDDRVSIQFEWPQYSATNQDFAIKCLPPAHGCWQVVRVTAGETLRDVDFPRAGVSQITGMIWDDKNANGVREAGEDGAPFLRVFLDDDRDGVADPGEPASYKTNITGYYSLPIPSRYQAAGGNLPPLVLERAAGADCTAPATCVNEGLRSTTHDVVRAHHGVARPVVIFVHGYGGSRISCPGKYMWFNAGRLGPDLMDMRLGEDGESLRESAGGSTCSQNAGPDGLLLDVAGADIYGDTSKHFETITWPGRHYDYVWDWRKDPTKAVPGLDALVEQARAAHGVKQVVLVGHSMGGLVMRHYIETPSQADKVARMVTVGTPYWGSPKTIFPLASGEESPMLGAMDVLMSNSGLKAASRTFPGHFSLMPAFGYGPWLSVAGMNGGRPLDMDGLRTYLDRIGVEPRMYTNAAAEHGRVLDHYADHGVPYHVIVGGGVPTIGAVGIAHGVQDTYAVSWVSGDKTVPMFSAAMDTPRDRLHVVCGIEHVPLTADPQTTKLMDEFLIRGDEIRDERTDCEWTARELSYFYPDSLTAMSSQAKAPRVVAAGRSYTLRDAERLELVQVLELGGSVKIVARGGSDIRVELPAGGTAIVRDLSSKGAGPEKRFAISGTTAFALGGSGAVTSGGKTVKPAARDTKPPVTRASVKRVGGKVRLTLRARDASKVAATYVFVSGKRRAYKKPLVIAASKLKKVTYGSVDIWGNAETARKAPRR
jgi:pimeloyl-ACP methyl ester carboxylesterase